MNFFDLETGDELGAPSSRNLQIQDAVLLPATTRLETQDNALKVGAFDLYVIAGSPQTLWHVTTSVRY